LHHVVHASRIFNILLLNIPLFFSNCIFHHFSVPYFSIGLSFSSMAFSCHKSTLLNSILTKDIIISFLFNLLSITWYTLKLCDYSDAFATIKSGVIYLSLEWKTLNLSKIDVIHLKQFWNFLQGVFKHVLCVFCYVTNIFHEKRHIFREICLILVPELHTFMEQHLSNNVRGNNWLSENVCKIFCKRYWIDSFNFSTSKFSKLA
jgi:hypothetical protein